MNKLKAKFYSLLFALILGSAFVVVVGHFGDPNGHRDRNDKVLFVAEWGSTSLHRLNVNITWSVAAHIEGPIKLTNIDPRIQKDWNQPYIQYDGFSLITMEVTSVLADFVVCKIYIGTDLKDTETLPHRARCFWPQ